MANKKSNNTQPPASKKKASVKQKSQGGSAHSQSKAQAGSQQVSDEQAYKRLIIVGSPRVNGRSGALAQQLFDTCLEDYPDDVVTIVSVASLTIGPCIACDACKENVCTIDDDMDQVLELVDTADEIFVVSPVYFAGPPAQFKALLDRLQPFFWTNARHEHLRPLTLHIIGEGHDPFGYDPLVSCVSSAFYCAGFELNQILDWVGKLNESGDILADPDVYVLEETEDGVQDDDAGAAGENASVLSDKTGGFSGSELNPAQN